MQKSINWIKVGYTALGSAIGMLAGAGMSGLLTRGMRNKMGQVMCGTDKIAFFAAEGIGGAIGGAAGYYAQVYLDPEEKFDPQGLAMSVAMGTIMGIAGAAEAWKSRACFVADTPLLTPNGHKLIQDFKVGDLITSRPEHDPDAPLEVQRVEEIFVRTAPILNLHINGKVIQTTKEHPFWVAGKGWIDARDLQPGDLLSSHDGRWIPVEEVFDTGEWQTVYNLQVSDYHTYFVGSEEWAFTVWAHNAGPEYTGPKKWKKEYDALPDGDWGKGPTLVKQRYLDYLDVKAKAKKKPSSPSAWWKKTKQGWENTGAGGKFEKDARKAMGADLGKGSKPTTNEGARIDVPSGEYDLPLANGKKARIKGTTEVKGELKVNNRKDKYQKKPWELAFKGAQDRGEPLNLIIAPHTKNISRDIVRFINETGGKVYEFNPTTGKFTEVKLPTTKSKKGWKRS